MSMTGDLLKRRRLERQNKNKLHSKRRETEILTELKVLLEEYLQENDRIMVEIDQRYLSEFINITDSIKNIYDMQQVDTTLFVFSNREFG